MEITNFLTQSFITTFTGTLVSIELIVFMTKELPFIKKIPTRAYTFILAIAHCIIISKLQGTLEFSLRYIYLLLLNTMLVTVLICGGYDVVVGNVNIALSNYKSAKKDTNKDDNQKSD